jgi:aminomethyltransferase
MHLLSCVQDKTHTRRRVGVTVQGAPARDGAPLFDADGNEVGVVTSGTFSPCRLSDGE